MRDLVEEFTGIFRIRLDDKQPAMVPKMTLNIKEEPAACTSSTQTV
jgi:hypothetical protein